MQAKQAYSAAVYATTLNRKVLSVEAAATVGHDFESTPWERARVTFTWRACHLPDQANVLPNCKALLDILCTAPPEKPGTKHPNRTTYLGILEDDKHVEAVGKVERVRHRADEGVLVEVERL